jgi:hypothetical protein
MKLTASKVADDTCGAEEGSTDESSHATTMREYEARRCHICQCKFPSFGFGPPLRVGGAHIWSCRAHRDQVDWIARGATVSPTDPQPRLL